MNRIFCLEEKVRAIYEAQLPDRAAWADWLYEHHVFVVADEAKKLAERYDVDPTLPQAAGMLHDCADAIMSRFAPDHSEQSAHLARTILTDCGFSESEITIVVDDALRFHSCRDSQIPQTPVGKIVATADAVAHITSDYYQRAHTLLIKEGQTLVAANDWVCQKLDRDFSQKLLFPEVKQEVYDAYLASKEKFVTILH